MSATSLARALSIVHEVAEHGPSTVPKIAVGVGLPVSTTYRLLAVLVDLGYLAPTGKAGWYGPGPQLGWLAAQVPRQSRAQRVAAAQEAIRAVAPRAPEPWVALLAGRVVDALDPVEVPQ